jgi:hypothetical protein
VCVCVCACVCSIRWQHQPKRDGLQEQSDLRVQFLSSFLVLFLFSSISHLVPRPGVVQHGLGLMSGVHNHAVNLIRVAKDAVAQQQVVSAQHHSRPFVFYKSVERVNLDVGSFAVYLSMVQFGCARRVSQHSQFRLISIQTDSRASGSMSFASGGTS